MKKCFASEKAAEQTVICVHDYALLSEIIPFHVHFSDSLCAQNNIKVMLKGEALRTAGERKAKKASTEQYINDILCASDNPLVATLARAKAGQLPAEDMMSMLDSLIAQDKERSESIKGEETGVSKRIEEISGILTRAAEQEKIRKSRENAQEALEKKQAEAQELAANLEEADKKVIETQPLEKEVSDIEHELPQ